MSQVRNKTRMETDAMGLIEAGGVKGEVVESAINMDRLRSRTIGIGELKPSGRHSALGKLSGQHSDQWFQVAAKISKSINRPTDRMPPTLIRAFGFIKGAAAKVNAENGVLGLWCIPRLSKTGLLITMSDPRLGKAIQTAADGVSSLKLIDHFPLVVWQTGSGTQTNMNTNEVMSNRANEILGSPRGSKEPVHPNDQANMCGSSNDGMATAMHITAILDIEDLLLPSLESLTRCMWKKTEEFKGITKVGRTHLQDAVPLGLDQEFSGFATQLDLGRERIEHALQGLRYLTMGGTAVGTGLNTFAGFDREFAEEMSRRTGKRFSTSQNKMEAISANDAIVHASGALNTLACSLFKIAQDVRFEGGGPRCGLGELLLPENEPGSSYMPGKVNPTQCESLTMICAKVIANHTGITIRGLSGQLQLNAFKPLLTSSLLHSVRLLADGMRAFERNCLQGPKADRDRISLLMENKYVRNLDRTEPVC